MRPAHGNRIAKTVTSGGASPTTTQIKDIYQGGRIAYETDGANTILATFAYDDSGMPTSVQVGSDPATAPRYYYVYNTHGDVVALVDSNGTSVSAYSYDAFGAVQFDTDNFSNGWHNPYLYDGRDRVRYDSETGLYWMSVRAYDPTLGRFISRDPLGRMPLMGWLSQPYAYAGNNPLTNVDPSGQLLKGDDGGGYTPPPAQPQAPATPRPRPITAKRVAQLSKTPHHAQLLITPGTGKGYPMPSEPSGVISARRAAWGAAKQLGGLDQSIHDLYSKFEDFISKFPPGKGVLEFFSGFEEGLNFIDWELGHLEGDFNQQGNWATKSWTVGNVLKFAASEDLLVAAITSAAATAAAYAGEITAALTAGGAEIGGLAGAIVGFIVGGIGTIKLATYGATVAGISTAAGYIVSTAVGAEVSDLTGGDNTPYYPLPPGFPS